MTLSEDEYAIHVDKMVHNLIADETAYIIDTRRQYVDFQDVYGILKEEVEETAEELTALEDNLGEYWKLVRRNAPEEVLIQKLEIIEHNSVNIIAEAKQVGAVAKKARLQLAPPKQNIDVETYKLGQALKGYGKSSCHRPK